MTAQEIIDRRSYPPRDVTMLAPVSREELDGVVCARRSGLTPTDEMVDRLIATCRALMRLARTAEGA